MSKCDVCALSRQTRNKKMSDSSAETKRVLSPSRHSGELDRESQSSMEGAVMTKSGMRVYKIVLLGQGGVGKSGKSVC